MQARPGHGFGAVRLHADGGALGGLDDPLEKDADRAAERAMTLLSATPAPAALPSFLVRPPLARGLQRAMDPDEAEAEAIAAGGEPAVEPVGAESALEDEADRIADQVIATPAHHAISGSPPHIQRFSGQSNGQMDVALASVDQALASPGRPLEQRLGHDFSQVRVHSGTAAEQSAREVNANAYTLGHNMVFAAGRFAPGSREGRTLLAHELTHVVQQRAGPAHGMQRDPEASESLPKKAKVIKLGEGRYEYDFGRPITKEPAAQLIGLQTNLNVDEPGDIYEREADRIADQVIATPAHHAISGSPPHIQRFSGQSNGQMDVAPASVDQALASPGRPLEPALRQDMEQRLGHDFSQVRVHSGTAAEQSAREVNANAYTLGHNMVFAAGRFAPGSREGRKLLAHELTHVVQQRAGHAHGMQRDPEASESLPKKAKVIKLGEGRYEYDFGRPITKEQAAQLIFVDGKVPDEAKLVRGPGNHSWTMQTFDIEGQQATVNKMRARTEIVSPGKPTEPLVPGQWNPPPPHEVTVEWTDGPTKPSTGPKREDLRNDLGFTITKNYKLDEGQSPTKQVKKAYGMGMGHGYELAFEKPVTKAQVMDTLFGENDLGEGTVKLVPHPSEPTTKWQVHVIGVDALTAFKRPVFRAIADANTEAGESIAPDVPSGIRTHIENRTIPKDAVKHHPPNVYVWEQEGHLVHVETDGKGKKGYYAYETTKIDHADEASKITMRYFMMEQGMRPREAWQEYIKHWDEINLTMLGTISLSRARWKRPGMAIKGSTPAPGKTRPVPALTVRQGGGHGSGTPTGMLRDTDAASRGVRVPASHPVFKSKLPANDPPTPPQGQVAKVAVNAPKNPPHGQHIDPAQGPSAPGQNPDPTRMGKKPPTSDPNLKKSSGPPADKLDPGEGDTTKKPRRNRGGDEDLPRKQKISDSYDKPELEQSPELIAILSEAKHRRLYMMWLKKSHLGKGHPHINPAKNLDGSVQQFIAEEAITLPKK